MQFHSLCNSPPVTWKHGCSIFKFSRRIYEPNTAPISPNKQEMARPSPTQKNTIISKRPLSSIGLFSEEPHHIRKTQHMYSLVGSTSTTNQHSLQRQPLNISKVHNPNYTPVSRSQKGRNVGVWFSSSLLVSISSASATCSGASHGS